MKYLLCLGSNLGDRLGNLEAACSSLVRISREDSMRRSSVYRTKPFGVENEQPDYLNMVVELESTLSPRAMLGACLGIEAALGRVRPVGEIKAARIIDIDILMCFDEKNEMITSSDPELELPHPRMFERAFVLVPCSELFPNKEIYGVNFENILKNLDISEIFRF